MLHPTINELTDGGKINRYELALATAKCARKITDEYARQRDQAERSLTGNKETDKPIMNMIDPCYRDEKAVNIAINKIYNGEYTIVEHMPEEEKDAEEAAPAVSEDGIPAISFDENDEDADDETSDEDPDVADEASDESADETPAGESTDAE